MKERTDRQRIEADLVREMRLALKRAALALSSHHPRLASELAALADKDDE